MTELYNEKTFEREIFRIAENVFAPLQSKKENYFLKSIDDEERDGFYESEFVVHCVEITVSRKRNKTVHDLDKLKKTIEYYNSIYKGEKAVRGFFITLHPLSPEQSDLKRQYSSTIRFEDYHTFLGRLIDSQEYLRAREAHTFGSIQDLKDRRTSSTYIEPKLFRKIKGKKPFDVNTLSQHILKGIKKKILVEGDFGTGKSMAAKRLFENLSKFHIEGKSKRFPIYLNLREFSELESADEALQRHARRIGVSDMGDRLIRAWKADYTILIVDGFDEVTPRITAKDNKRIKDIRFQALELVRNFIRNSNHDTPLVICGRTNFFGTDEELQESLNIDENWERLSLRDFDEAQAEQLLRKLDCDVKLPNWLPRRPLLIAYFAQFELYNMNGSEDDDGSAAGWAKLLDKICEREVGQIDKLPLTKSDLLEIYGHLALVARRRISAVGPISVDDLRAVFRTLFNDEASGAALGQLMRLPCLIHSEQSTLDSTQSYDARSNAKNFISEDFVNVASTSLFSSFLKKFEFDMFDSYIGVRHTVNSCGTENIAKIISELSDNQISETLKSINTKNTKNPAQIDIILGMIHAGKRYTSGHIEIEGIEIDFFRIPSLSFDFSRICFKDCIFERFNVDCNTGSTSYLPKFSNCIIFELEIPSSNLASNVFDSDCSISKIVDSDMTTNGFLQMALKQETKIACTILHKIYRQSGSGRLESALKRGMSDSLISEVDGLIDRLDKAEIIVASRVGPETRWHPRRPYYHNISEFLDSPSDQRAKRIFEGIVGRK